jgi:Spy/CpxP family protein refolding chaperone
MMRRSLGLTALALLLAATTVTAQPVAGSPNPNRAALEQRFREQSAKVAQQRLGLTDAQLAQLSQSNARFAPQQNQLVAQERATRRQLRVEMMAGDQANQQHVSALLDDAMRLQKQRIALVEAEQKDLARFLTPVQRAGYLSLQAQVRRRAQELSRDNATRSQGLDQRQGSGSRRRPVAKHLP